MRTSGTVDCIRGAGVPWRSGVVFLPGSVGTAALYTIGASGPGGAGSILGVYAADARGARAGGVRCWFLSKKLVRSLSRASIS